MGAEGYKASSSSSHHLPPPSLSTFLDYTFTVFLACWSSAFPWLSKMRALALSRSFLSMPSLRGMAPTKMATSISLKPTAGSAVGITSVCVCVCVWEGGGEGVEGGWGVGGV